nr:MAG TPA: hypothetical protein [Caudoviricetes sp.]
MAFEFLQDCQLMMPEVMRIIFCFDGRKIFLYYLPVYLVSAILVLA